LIVNPTQSEDRNEVIVNLVCKCNDFHFRNHHANLLRLLTLFIFGNIATSMPVSVDVFIVYISYVNISDIGNGNTRCRKFDWYLIVLLYGYCLLICCNVYARVVEGQKLCLWQNWPGSIRVRYRKGPGWTGLDTNNLFLLNCRRERQTNPNPNPGPLR